MIKSVLVIAMTAASWPSAGSGGEEHGNGPAEERKTQPGVVVTVNPEARISVVGNGTIYRGLSCDRPIDLPIKIVNLAFVTTHLKARLVDPVPAESSVELLGNSLTGAREEHRVLRLYINSAGFVDVTVAFVVQHDIEDLDGRSRVHLLLECAGLPTNE